MGMGVGGQWIENKRETTHGQGQVCGDCGEACVEVGEGLGVNGNGKNTVKKSVSPLWYCFTKIIIIKLRKSSP